MFNSEFQTVTSSISLQVRMNLTVFCATNSLTASLFTLPMHYICTKARSSTVHCRNIHHFFETNTLSKHIEIQGKCLPNSTTPAATPKIADVAKPAAIISTEAPKQKEAPAPKEGKTPKTKDASKPKDAAKPKEAKVSQSSN